MNYSVFTKSVMLILVLVMVFSMTACSSNGSDSGTKPVETAAPADEKPNTVKTDETITVMLSAEPTAIVALTGITDQEACVIEYANSARLWEFNPRDASIEMSLAEKYESIDETHYRITLKEGIHYSDGTPVTAEDVRWTIATSSAAGQDWAKFIDVENTKVEDERHLVIAYERYVPGWDVALAESAAGIYSEAAVNAVGGLTAAERNQPVSCGRYSVTEWKTGEYMLLERNENYWDPEYFGYYKYIKVMWASDSATRVLAIKSGDVQVANTISISESVNMKNETNVKTTIVPTSTTFNVYFNNTNGPFADPKLREACSYLIDSAGINALVNMGMGEVAQGFVPKQNVEYYHEFYEGGVNPYDPEKGKQLLKDAGYGDGLTVECVILKANLAPATVIQEAFRNAGITMNITTLEPANFVPEARAGNYDISIGTNSNGFLSPDNFKLVDPDQAFSTIGGPKITDPAMTEIINRAMSFDRAAAKQGWSDCIDYLFTNHSVVGLYHKLVCAAYSPDITGVSFIKRDYLNITELHPVS